MKYLKLIPANWNGVKVSTYLEVINQLPAEQPDDYSEDEYNTEILETWFYYLTGEDITEADIKADEVSTIVNRLLFIQEMPKEKNNKIRVKKAEDLSYQEFINYQKLAQDPINNMAQIVKLFSIDDLDENEINVADAYSCFFLLKKNVIKSLNRSLISLGWKVIKQSLKALLKRIRNLLRMSSQQDLVT